MGFFLSVPTNPQSPGDALRQFIRRAPTFFIALAVLILVTSGASAFPINANSDSQQVPAFVGLLYCPLVGLDGSRLGQSIAVAFPASMAVPKVDPFPSAFGRRDSNQGQDWHEDVPQSHDAIGSSYDIASSTVKLYNRTLAAENCPRPPSVNGMTMITCPDVFEQVSWDAS
jgi:hypothetical protein